MEFDYVLVGGGLQNALLALALLSRDPDARIALLEKDSRLGGNHTWCFHESDVSDEIRDLVSVLLVRRWPAHEVRFPKVQRIVHGSYAMVSSERLHEVVSAKFALAANARLFFGETAMDTDSDLVVTTSGQRFAAKVVVDSRGPQEPSLEPCAFQKFIGLELDLAHACPITIPRLMDAGVEQVDGFRFVYTLPLGERRVLIEDTYYSRSPKLDSAQIEARIRHYASQLGLQIQAIHRVESGVLPLPIHESRSPVVSERAGVIRIVGGYRGGWFHPTTGYSFPVAAKLVAYLMARPVSAVRLEELHSLVEKRRRQARFAIRLNQLLFGAFAPQNSYGALERFYQLPDDTIRRFYALQTTPADRLRILCGRPPTGFSLGRMIHSLRRGVLHDPATT
jgi:lycopene beta-cyclase